MHAAITSVQPANPTTNDVLAAPHSESTPVASRADDSRAAGAASVLSQRVSGEDVAPATLVPRRPFKKPTRGELGQTQFDELGQIKFVDGTGVRLQHSKLAVDQDALRLSRAERFGITRSTLALELAEANKLLRDHGATIERLFVSTPDDQLAAHQAAGEAKTGEELPELNLFFQARCPTTNTIIELLDSLNRLQIVEYATSNLQPSPPLAADIPPTTPDYTFYQSYFAPAPNGLDVPYARQLSGGRGEGVRVTDVEQGWYEDHEDFPPVVSTSGLHDDYPPNQRHGTGVIGVIAAVENDYGMTGIAPLAEISTAAVAVQGLGNQYPDAMQRASAQSRTGDIILVEFGWFTNDGKWLPGEWDNGVFAAVQTAIANGRIVIVPAANGGHDLDDATAFGTRFNRAVEDTGSIYVGAGSPDTRARLAFSNYGSRLDVQAWGSNVASLGGNSLNPGGDDYRQGYDLNHTGTSSAGAMIAGAAALIQSVRRARGLPDLTSPQMRAALAVGGTPQTQGGGTIGPLPNLREALAAIPRPAPLITATGSASAATISWSAIQGISGYKVFRRDSHGSRWNLIATLPPSAISYVNAGVTQGKTYLYTVRTFDNVSESPESNYELATAIDYDDAPLTSVTHIQARHLIAVRTAVNAICEYAGAPVCSSAPFAGSALDEGYVTGRTILASDFAGIQSHLISLRSAIGASPATFHETLTVGAVVRALHMEDLRAAAR